MKKSGKRIKAEQVEKIFKKRKRIFPYDERKIDFFPCITFSHHRHKKKSFSFLTEKISPLFFSFFYAFLLCVAAVCIWSTCICVCVWEQQARGWLGERRETFRKTWTEEKKFFVFHFSIFFFTHKREWMDHAKNRTVGGCWVDVWQFEFSISRKRKCFANVYNILMGGRWQDSIYMFIQNLWYVCMQMM